MSVTNSSKVSVVIPCFNEEVLINRCLKGLSEQTVTPYEVIVVDNNCSDGTVEIAKKYGARVVNEPVQGLIAARNTGFNAAKGNIIAKLDADSIPANDWIASLRDTFEDDSVIAATGTGDFYDAPFKWFVRAYRNLFAVWLNWLVLGHHMLWGSNLAIRTEAWHLIADECCQQRDIMEDLDMAAHVVSHFGKKAVRYDPQLRVDISGRRAMVSLKRNWLYLRMWPYTLSLHGYERRILLWPAIAFLLGSMYLGTQIGRFYCYEEDRMIISWRQWRSTALYTRDNP
jgi:glycosyltransferase involved in cell wall biosynthesis